MNKLKQMRTDMGMTVVGLAERSGVSRQTIHKLESNEVLEASTKTLRALADAVGCNVSDFFEK